MNYALQPMTKEAFVELVTADQPDAPPYFTYDAVLNTQDRPTLDQALERELQPLTLDEAIGLAAYGAQLLDTRDPADYTGAHLRGTISVGLGGSFATWCGAVLDPQRPIVLVSDPGSEAEAATRLGRIGFDTVAGYVAGGMQALDDAPNPIDRIARITAGSLAEQLASGAPPVAVDVRAPGEWAAGHIDEALHVPLLHLRERLDALPQDRALVVYCASGYRATIAAYCKEVKKTHGKGLLLDVHGQGSFPDAVVRGTQNGKTVALLVQRYGEKAHTGPKSFFGLLAAHGCKVNPADLTGKEAPAHADTDVSSEDDTQRMAETAMKEFGRIDILLNNAAIY